MISLSFFRRSRHGNGKTSHLLDRYSSMLMHFEPSVRLFSTPNGLHCIISCFLRVRNHPDSKGNSDVPQYPAAQICKDVTVIGMYVYIVCVCIRMYIYIYTIIIYIYICVPHHLCWQGWREYLRKFNHIGSKCSPPLISVLLSFNILKCSCSMACLKNVSMVPHEVFLKPSQKHPF